MILYLENLEDLKVIKSPFFQHCQKSKNSGILA